MEPFIAQIILFGGNFAPRGWAFCDGQLLPIAENSALFSILGTTYGGDGRTTFALPDLRGRAPIHAGNGPGLSDHRLGSRAGTENNTLTTAQIPSHNHAPQLHAVSEDGTTQVPTDANHADDTRGQPYKPGGTLVNMATDSISSSNVGGNQPISNMQPYLAMNYIIALQGIFPSRN